MASRSTYIDSADGIAALLDAAKTRERRALLAVAIFTGPRVSELCALRSRHVDLPGGWLSVAGKTDVGVRRVTLRPTAREELARVRPENADPDAFVFPSPRGKRYSSKGIERVVDSAAEAANADLTKRALPLLPELTPHSLRRTFTSVLCACGEDLGVITEEAGHTDIAFTYRIYRQAMRRSDDENAKLRALVDGVFWADDWANERANVPDSAS